MDRKLIDGLLEMVEYCENTHIRASSKDTMENKTIKNGCQKIGITISAMIGLDPFNMDTPFYHMMDMERERLMKLRIKGE